MIDLYTCVYIHILKVKGEKEKGKKKNTTDKYVRYPVHKNSDKTIFREFSSLHMELRMNLEGKSASV